MCKSSREDPYFSEEKHSSMCLGGMHKQERESCHSLQELSTTFLSKNSTYVLKSVTHQLWSSLKICKLDRTEEFLQIHSTHWHEMQ